MAVHIHQFQSPNSPRSPTRVSEIKPCTCGHLIYDKGGKSIQWRKDNLFNTWCWESWTAAAAAKALQSCPTLCDPIDGSPPGFPIPGILQARTVAISLSNAWKWKVKVKMLSRVRFLVTPWTAAYQAPLFMGFSRQEYWSGVPLPSPGERWTATGKRMKLEPSLIPHTKIILKWIKESNVRPL